MSIGQINVEARTIELAFSSEAKVTCWPGITEVLSHEPGACDLGRLNDRANLLFNHDPDIVLGVVESARIDGDGYGRAVVRFGKSEEAEKAWRDVQDGILSKVSVGYRIKDIKSITQSDDSEVYTATHWEPYEISLVTIPADTSVGIGRSLSHNHNYSNTQKMSENTATLTPAEALATTPEEPKIRINIEAERNIGRQSEQERVQSIAAAGEQYNMNDIAMRAIKEGKSLSETKDLFLAELNQRNYKIIDGSRPIGLSEREARSFSIVKLLRSAAFPEDMGAREEAAFEREVCRATANQRGKTSKGFLIPSDVLNTPLIGERGNNTLSISSGAGLTGTGGALVAKQLLSASFIDVLRDRTVLMRMSRKLVGLSGDVFIPRKKTAAKGYWAKEGQRAEKQDIDFDQISLKPKIVANHGELTHSMILQSGLDVEALVREDLIEGIGHAIDYAGFYGDGKNNDPIGIKHTEGINLVKFAGEDPTYKELVAMETEIAQKNAAVKNMTYVVNSSFKGNAKTSLKFPNASTNGGTIWEPGDTVNGYATEETNQITKGDVFFGNFEDLIIGLWGGLEVLVNPYARSTEFIVGITCRMDVDFVIRRGASFCYGNKQVAKA